MIKQVKDLFEGITVDIPYFDFSVKIRDPQKARRLTLPKDGILLVEGLHGLSKEVSGCIPKDQWYGVFIMPAATLTDDYRLLDKRDIRILRRITRDVLHRGASALATIDYWPMLDQAERRYLPITWKVRTCMSIPLCLTSFLHRAHGARHDCEIPAELSRRIGCGFEFTKSIGFAQIDLALQEAERLLAATDKIPRIDLDLVPESSIINEFIR